jgi:para-aminobenzoate synthetase component I
LIAPGLGSGEGGALLVVERDWMEPAAAAACWAGAPHLTWLDSADAGSLRAESRRSRYSYLAPDPFRHIVARGTRVFIDGVLKPGDPFTVLEAELASFRTSPTKGPVPFLGGAVGFLGYGLAHHLERLPRRHAPAALPDMAVAFHDIVIAFDHRERRVWLCASGLPAPPGVLRRGRAKARVAEAEARLARPARDRATWMGCDSAWQPDLDRSRYEDAVATVLGYIRAGDIFQANVTTSFRAAKPEGMAAFDLYLALRRRSPAPFGAYLSWGTGEALLSASPERFLSLDSAGRVETRPIKGTRPRRASPQADLAEAEALRMSMKDRAENLMIVDLMRNDLGRVAATGSVAVPSLCAVESFASVHHLVSEVTARLRPGLGPVDLLRASFPGGSVTGAPKIRAMEIIEDVEMAARGAYCGAVAWIGFDGAMDSNIIIRTLSVSADEVIAQAGGGIVADSEPAAEYDEMRVKIAPLLAAFSEPAP